MCVFQSLKCNVVQVRVAPALNVRIVAVGAHIRISPALDDFETALFSVLDRCGQKRVFIR